MLRETQTDVKPSKKGRTSCQAYKDEIQNDLFIFKQHCCHDYEVQNGFFIFKQHCCHDYEVQNGLFFIFKQHCCHDYFARERVDDCGWGDGGSIVVRVRVEGRCLCTSAVDESKRFLAEVLTHTQ